MTRRVLLVDDDASVRAALGQTLELAEFLPTVVGSYIEAKDHIDAEFAGVVVSDIRMPGKDGFALLEHVLQTDPDLPVILLTGEGTVPTAVRGMSRGAFDFLEKPCAPADLVETVARALANRALVLENRALKRQVEAGDAASRMLFGDSDLSKALRHRVRLVAGMRSEVLISGHPGSGTSKVAEVIHLLSDRSARSFRKCSAAAMTADTMKSVISDCSGGTLYIDEIGDASVQVQYVLLEQLETVYDTRILAGTSRDLAQDVAEGRFNADLFYKLDVMNVRIPSLNERKEDIPVLFRHYVAIACEQAALPLPVIGADTLASLMEQDWPGNARALMSAAMRFALGLSDPVDSAQTDLGLAEQMARVEQSLIVSALIQFQGNATGAANSLKLPRKTFYDKLAKHGIKPETYRR